MCGVGLIYNISGQAPQRQCIKRGVRALIYRGPDARAARVHEPEFELPADETRLDHDVDAHHTDAARPIR